MVPMYSNPVLLSIHSHFDFIIFLTLKSMLYEKISSLYQHSPADVFLC